MINRAIPPNFVDISSLNIQHPNEISSSNGLNLYWLDNKDFNVIKVELVFSVGTKHQDKPLLASFTNELVFEGTDKYSSEEIAEKFDYYGAQPKTSITSDRSSFSLICLKKDFFELYPYFLEVIFNASYPEQEVNIHRKRKKQNYILNKKKVSYLAGEQLNKVLFESTKYESKNNEEAYDNISASELKEFHSRYYRNAKFDVFCSGNVSDNDANKILDLSSTYFSSKTNLTEMDRVVESISKEVKLEVIKGTQSCVKFGKIIDVDYASPDFFYLNITNTLLGGFFGSRLMQNIREDKGYTYGIGSGFSVLENASFLSISTEVDNKYIDDTIAQINYELDRLANELITEDELEILTNYIKGGLLKANDGVFLIMDNFKSMKYHNQSLEYFNQYFNFLNSIDPSKIKEVARQYFNKNSFSTIVVS